MRGTNVKRTSCLGCAVFGRLGAIAFAAVIVDQALGAPVLGVVFLHPMLAWPIIAAVLAAAVVPLARSRNRPAREPEAIVIGYEGDHDDTDREEP